MDAAIEDRGHVRAQVTPGDAQRYHQQGDDSEESHADLKPLGLEHGHAQVDEDDDRDRQQDALGGGHTLSSAQIRPSMATANPMMPRTVKKSAMALSLPPAL
jgi:hypothetical protein